MNPLDGLYMRIHLVNGTHVDSDVNEFDREFTAEETKGIEAFKDFIKDGMKSVQKDGMELSFNRPGGGWGCVQRSAILWVEFVNFGAGPE